MSACHQRWLCLTFPGGQPIVKWYWRHHRHYSKCIRGQWTTMGQNQAIWVNGWCCVQSIILVPFTSLWLRLCQCFHNRATILEAYNLAIKTGFWQKLDIQDRTCSVRKWFLKYYFCWGRGYEYDLLFQMFIEFWNSKYISDIEKWHFVSYSTTRRNQICQDGQTILIVTGLAENIFIFQNVLSRPFKAGVCVTTQRLLFWYIERHDCVKIKELKRFYFQKITYYEM